MYRVVIADGEEDYLKGMVSYFLWQKEIPIEVYGFSDKVLLEGYLKDNEIDILIVSMDLFDEGVKHNVKHTILLSKGSVPKKYLEYTSVFKYSNMQDIWKQVLDIVADQESSLLMKNPSQTKVIGIYSPVGQSGKTTLSIALSSELSKRGKTILINLERYSTLEDLLGTIRGKDLGEILLYAKQRSSNLALKLEVLKQSTPNFDCLPTIDCYDDLKGTLLEEWQYIVEHIMQLGYKYIVFDLGEFESLLQLCENIIVPISLSSTSLIKFQKWTDCSSNKRITGVITGYREETHLPANLQGLIKLPYFTVSTSTNHIYPFQVQEILRGL